MYIVPLVGGSGKVEYVETARDATCSSMAVRRFDPGDPRGASTACGLSGAETSPLPLSPVSGGVGGTRDARAPFGFEYTLPDSRDGGAREFIRMMSITPGARDVGPPRDPARSTPRAPLADGDAKPADHRGEKALGVSGKVCRSVRAVDGIDSPLELSNGVGMALLSSDRRPRGRGGGGPAGRDSLAICRGKLSKRSGESTGVSTVVTLKRAEVGVGFGNVGG